MLWAIDQWYREDRLGLVSSSAEDKPAWTIERLWLHPNYIVQGGTMDCVDPTEKDPSLRADAKR
jgi:hypothetical protein